MELLVRLHVVDIVEKVQPWMLHEIERGLNEIFEREKGCRNLELRVVEVILPEAEGNPFDPNDPIPF